MLLLVSLKLTREITIQGHVTLIRRIAERTHDKNLNLIESHLKCCVHLFLA